jgi:two-component system, cell cycle response regulator
VAAPQPGVAPRQDHAPVTAPVTGTATGPLRCGSVDVTEQPVVPTAASHELARLAHSHESIAALLASCEQWQQAYQHLRAALELRRTDAGEPVHVPERLRREVARLRREHAEAREESIRDSLTASYNRRYLSQRLVATDGLTGRAGLAVVLVDLDSFKQVNDRFGHLVGDRVLQRVVELLCAGLPDGAFCVRYGGEEFVLVLPGIDLETGIAVSEAARARVEAHSWGELAPQLRVTVSAGVAHGGPDTAGAAGIDHEQLLLHADALLYAAKQSGRNAVAYCRDGRVCLAGTASHRLGNRRCAGAVSPGSAPSNGWVSCVVNAVRNIAVTATTHTRGVRAGRRSRRAHGPD